MNDGVLARPRLWSTSGPILLLRAHNALTLGSVSLGLILIGALLPDTVGTTQVVAVQSVSAHIHQIIVCMAGLLAGQSTRSSSFIERQITTRAKLIHILLTPAALFLLAAGFAWLLLGIRSGSDAGMALVGYCGSLGVAMIGNALVPGELAAIPAVVWLGATFVVGADHEGHPHAWAWPLLISSDDHASTICAMIVLLAGVTALYLRNTDDASAI